MRIASVIGTVTFSRLHPTLEGYRWLIGVPYSLTALKARTAADGEDIVLLDQLGAGLDSNVGVSEGMEAAMPFQPAKVPVDAYCACILDSITIDKLAVS